MSEERPEDLGPNEDEIVTPPPFDPDPKLVSLLERGAKGDPEATWIRVTRKASR
jgi:hypothetical protein